MLKKVVKERVFNILQQIKLAIQPSNKASHADFQGQFIFPKNSSTTPPLVPPQEQVTSPTPAKQGDVTNRQKNWNRLAAVAEICLEPTYMMILWIGAL